MSISTAFKRGARVPRVNTAKAKARRRPPARRPDTPWRALPRRVSRWHRPGDRRQLHDKGAMGDLSDRAHAHTGRSSRRRLRGLGRVLHVRSRSVAERDQGSVGTARRQCGSRCRRRLAFCAYWVYQQASAPSGGSRSCSPASSSASAPSPGGPGRGCPSTGSSRSRPPTRWWTRRSPAVPWQQPESLESELFRVPVGMSAGGGRMCPLGHTPTATGTLTTSYLNKNDLQKVGHFVELHSTNPSAASLLNILKCPPRVAEHFSMAGHKGRL